MDPEDMLIPRRWQMVLILTSGTFLAFVLRVNISVAVVEMQESLGWSDGDKGLVLSAFYIGYALGQIPSTYITHWYGAKWLFGISILLTSIFTIFFPAVIKASFPLGIFLRILIGFTGSSLFPSVYYFYKAWVPLSEKTLMIPFINCGCYLVRD
jgi:sugar phosphate permease